VTWKGNTPKTKSGSKCGGTGISEIASSSVVENAICDIHGY